MLAGSGRVVVLATAIVVALLLTGDGTRGAGASVMIWPIDPVMKSHERATAVWIENRGQTPVTLQVRVLRWDVEDYADRYVEQHDDVVGSPPVATIASGRRQLVRLIKVRQPAAGTEAAYRVLIDELPSTGDAGMAAPTRTSMGVTFRMRYSLPFFVYGEGLSPIDRRSAAAPTNETASQSSALSWRIVTNNGVRWLEIHNTGTHHARLTEVKARAPAGVFDIASGLLGYALPGKDVRWRLPANVPDDSSLDLEARVNGRQTMIPARP